MTESIRPTQDYRAGKTSSKLTCEELVTDQLASTTLEGNAEGFILLPQLSATVFAGNCQATTPAIAVVGALSRLCSLRLEPASTWKLCHCNFQSTSVERKPFCAAMS